MVEEGNFFSGKLKTFNVSRDSKNVVTARKLGPCTQILQKYNIFLPWNVHFSCLAFPQRFSGKFSLK